MLMKRTFYVQFCAGESPAEVQQTISGLKSMGFKGVILGHAREVVLSKDEEANLDSIVDSAETQARNAQEIGQWKQSTLDTVQLTAKDDFVALKFTGAGRQALQHLKNTTPCAPVFEDALHEICQLAQKRGVKLLFDAEQASLQQGIDNWTLYFMKIYNKGENPLVYGTYQAYAKRTPGLLAQHLSEGLKHDFAVGVKLVRGAYLGSDPRELFWETIEGTHKCYDNLARCVIQRQYEGLLQPVDGKSEFPRVGLVLASHNAVSVANARQLRDEQSQRGEQKVPLAYGQLMGMADNVSCELVQEATARAKNDAASVDVPQAYKYLVWGTLGECMKYLLRRAQENKDAVSRTIEARQALGKELARRMGISR